MLHTYDPTPMKPIDDYDIKGLASTIFKIIEPNIITHLELMNTHMTNESIFFSLLYTFSFYVLYVCIK